MSNKDSKQESVSSKKKGQKKGKQQKDKNKQQKPKIVEVKTEKPRPNRKGAMVNKNAPIKVSDALISSVQITAFMDPIAFNCFPLGLISQMAKKNIAVGNVVYRSYAAIINDFIQVMTGSKDALEQRLVYMNELYGSFRPKNISTKADNYVYKWSGPAGAFPPPNTITVRQFSYFFAEAATPDNDPSTPQVWSLTSTAVSVESANEGYSQCVTLLTEEDDCLQLVAPSEGSYNKDVSAFAQSAVYWGGGAGPAGGPFTSVEAEMPYRIGVLVGLFSQYNTVPRNRVSNFLKKASGDACAAFSYPFLERFSLENYRTVNPVRFKFIDFGEIYLTAAVWLAQSLQKAVDNNTPIEYVPIQLSSFLGALRQTIMRMFFDSQAIGQFMTYNVDGEWEAFKLGTNCVPQLETGINLPSILVENLRLLLPQIYEKPSEKFHRKRNVVIYVPVIGMDPNGTWTVPTYTTIEGISTPIFNTLSNPNVEMIDGSMGGNPINMNCKYFQAGIIAWNQIVAKLATFCGTVAQPTGSPPTGTLLNVTRYVNLTSVSTKELEKLPEWCPLPTGLARRKITRVDSKTKRNEDKFEIVGGSNLLTGEVTVYTSATSPISADLASILPQLIVPKIRISEMGIYDESAVQKFQTSYRERYSLKEMNFNDTTINPSNRASNITVAATAMAPGLAKDASTELGRVVNQLMLGQGGFISDILNGAGYIASMFGV